MDALDKLVDEATQAFERASSAAELEQIKARYLGKSGALNELLKGLGKLPPEQRPAAGSRINDAKARIESALAVRRHALAQSELDARLAEEALDVTLPGRGRGRAGVHPITRTWQRVASGAVPLPAPGTSTAATGSVWYRSRITLDEVNLHDTPAGFHLIPGMPVTADVLVGKRTIMEYFLSRVMSTVSEGMREP